MALRIIAGDLKGRKLRSVCGTGTRPTANRTREAIFNILASRVRGSNVLDLFAGTGAFGIEALSRKAHTAVFVDNDHEALLVLQSNLRTLSLESRSKIIRWDLLKNLNCLIAISGAFDLVFMDPPYNQNMIEPGLRNLYKSQSLDAGALVVVEHSRLEPVTISQMPYRTVDQRKYGKSLVTILNYVV
ncbi:MAG: 16S rRNA (guanine(966)-N(2))-methyltransferase RsmD [Desulfobacterales bacterium]|nr:16S rRNA (guanine(966)-N(2))-methyltransferase RsmD [Desulfobacterales bacterium]